MQLLQYSWPLPKAIMQKLQFKMENFYSSMKSENTEVFPLNVLGHN